MYFPESSDCPINNIYIDNIQYGIDNSYSNIFLGNDSYLHFTNKKTQNKIIVDIRVGPSSIPLQFDSENTNELCEILKSDKTFTGKCQNYYKFNTIPFYKEIDSLSYNDFIHISSDLTISNEEKVVNLLYMTKFNVAKH